MVGCINNMHDGQYERYFKEVLFFHIFRFTLRAGNFLPNCNPVAFMPINALLITDYRSCSCFHSYGMKY